MSMITTATDAEVISHIGHLISSFGVSPNISDQTLARLRTMHKDGQSSKCISEIKSLLRLELTLKIGYLNNKPSGIDLIKLIMDKMPTHELPIDFQSPKTIAHIQETLDKAGAFVIRSTHLPLYGSPSFNNFKILIFIFRWMTNYPLETFLYCIAHELTHIVLDAIRHPLRNNEVAVDLAAMLFGFSDVIKVGRKIEGSPCGYLDDHQFQIAYQEIKKRSQIIYL